MAFDPDEHCIVTKDTRVAPGAITSLRHLAMNMHGWNHVHAYDVFKRDLDRETTFGFFLRNAMRYGPSKRKDAIRVLESLGAQFKETRGTHESRTT